VFVIVWARIVSMRSRSMLPVLEANPTSIDWLPT